MEILNKLQGDDDDGQTQMLESQYSSGETGLKKQDSWFGMPIQSQGTKRNMGLALLMRKSRVNDSGVSESSVQRSNSDGSGDKGDSTDSLTESEMGSVINEDEHEDDGSSTSEL